MKNAMTWGYHFFIAYDLRIQAEGRGSVSLTHRKFWR